MVKVSKFLYISIKNKVCDKKNCYCVFTLVKCHLRFLQFLANFFEYLFSLMNWNLILSLISTAMVVYWETLSTTLRSLSKTWMVIYWGPPSTNKRSLSRTRTIVEHLPKERRRNKDTYSHDNDKNYNRRAKQVKY